MRTTSCSVPLLILSSLIIVLLWQPQNVTASSKPKQTNNNPILKFFSRIFPKRNNNKMGQVVRVMKYDRAANVANAIPALDLVGSPLRWHRLDDGVMGGRSETLHEAKTEGLHYTGTINTEGGGFTSIRAPIENCFEKNIIGLKLKFQGDDKTYKLLLTDGNSAGSPFSRSPSWQADLPTVDKTNGNDKEDLQETTIFFDSLKPSFGPRSPSKEEAAKYKFDPTEMKEIGLMLSLLLSDGTSNPKETFGEGIFPFSLFIKSIEPVTGDANTNE